MSVERASGQFLVGDELARIRHPFVDEDEHRTVGTNECVQCFARISAGPVRTGNNVVGLPATQLPRELAPQRVHLGTVFLDAWRPRLQIRAHQGDAPYPQVIQPRVTGVLDQVLYFLRKIVLLGATEQVVKGQHGVGFTTAEVSLQVHHRAGVGVPAEASQSAGEQVPQPLGQVGAAEKLDRVAVFAARLPLAHVVKVRGEFGRGKVTARHIVVRVNDFPPRFQPLTCAYRRRVRRL